MWMMRFMNWRRLGGSCGSDKGYKGSKGDKGFLNPTKETWDTLHFVGLKKKSHEINFMGLGGGVALPLGSLG